MKDEKETLRKTADSIHVMEKFDPAILADVTAPVVSLYIPVHHTEREERRDIWDRDMFKDLMKDAERTLAETYDKDAYKGIVEKADYLCLRDVSLSWSLPKAWLRKLHISDVTLTVSGNTLCYWTAVHGVSPEAATTGGLYTASSTYDTGFSPYPPTRKVLFTAKLTF